MRKVLLLLLGSGCLPSFEALRVRASVDLQCPPGAIAVEDVRSAYGRRIPELPPSHPQHRKDAQAWAEVFGCGHRAGYEVRCRDALWGDCEWVRVPLIASGSP